MNLIQQLQASPKWKEFEEWYKQQPEFISPYHISEIELDCGNLDAFKNFPFMLQKGVFEKFIFENNTDITVDGYLGNETYGIGSTFADWKWFENFEQLLIWYFNN